MLNTLSGNNILTGLIWEPSGHDNMDAGYMRWMVNIRRSHRMYVYRVQDEANTNELIGYSVKTAPGCESFAVHLRNLYGDGIYHFDAGDHKTYLLIIMDGIIISGSDCVITESFFSEIVETLPTSKYSRLQVSEITPAQLDCIAESCKENQLIYKRRQRLFWSDQPGGSADRNLVLERVDLVGDDITHTINRIDFIVAYNPGHSEKKDIDKFSIENFSSAFSESFSHYGLVYTHGELIYRSSAKSSTANNYGSGWELLKVTGASATDNAVPFGSLGTYIQDIPNNIEQLGIRFSFEM